MTCPTPYPTQFTRRVLASRMISIAIQTHSFIMTIGKGDSGLLPDHKEMKHLRSEYKLRFRDDKLYVYSMDDEELLCGLDEWISDAK